MLLSLVVAWTAAVAGADVVNPLKRENAPDPFTTYDAASGWYYHIHSDNPTDGSGGFTADRVVLHRSRAAGRLLNADESRVVYRANAADGVGVALADALAPECVIVSFGKNAVCI